jgi:hypothetical protein
MKLLIMQSSPASCHFLTLRSKYSPQHPVLRHLRSVLPLVLETMSLSCMLRSIRLTLWSRALLENLIITKLVKKLTFYGISKFYFRVQKKPTTGSYPKPVESSHNLTSYSLKFHFNIIFHYMFRSSKRYVSFGFCDYKFICSSQPSGELHIPPISFSLTS